MGVNLVKILLWVIMFPHPQYIHCTSPKHYFDSSKGILSYLTGSVFIYDQDVTIPFVYNLPKYKSWISPLVSQRCNTKLIVSQLVDDIIQDIEHKLPMFTEIKNRPDLTDSVLHNKKLQVNGAIQTQNGVYTRSEFFVEELGPSVKDLTRKRRFVIGGAALFTALATLPLLCKKSIFSMKIKI